MVFIEKKLQKRSLGKLNYNTDQDTNRNCTVYVSTDTDSDSLCLHTPNLYHKNEEGSFARYQGDSHRCKHTTCEAGDCAVHTYSVTAASSFTRKLQPFSYEARTETC